MQPTITSEVVVAYAQCPRKAYKLLYTDTQGIPHAYLSILEEEARKNRENHLKKMLVVRLHSFDRFQNQT